MSTPSATLTVWGSSWLAGRAAPDDVIDALRQWAPLHVVVSGDRVASGGVDPHWFSESDGTAAHLLRLLRSGAAAAQSFRLVLPAPGDFRGVPLGSPFATAAAGAGEGVILAGATDVIGLVPAPEGAEALRWSVYSLPCPGTEPVYPALGEAELMLREATREAATALAKLEFIDTSGGQDVRPMIVEALADLSAVRYPDSIPPRAARVFDAANEIDAILTVADQHGPIGAISAAQAENRESLLRPLRTAVREARLAAVHACVAETRRRT
ncbi:type I toxin-antitoxin system ptaRNA1 family toxin [Hoyosella altamirensis]|uniref:Uncharacterized protein n=1 Tax=Hoyosella altamirensis TaxID=616997 RepID=A0A839RUF2_9ACTN|nr:type I toxin-antitoxin system ptaRNA1 family toxin [Hoyosella altamirensis]MBB3039856.1 hypothetical protein [Hoyosella altamirensis]